VLLVHNCSVPRAFAFFYYRVPGLPPPPFFKYAMVCDISTEVSISHRRRTLLVVLFDRVYAE
jgi:hypothetical protein